MKKSLRLLSVVLSLTAGAWCQNITASGATCATSNACVSSQVTQAQGGATITLAGTFAATVQFEASVDGVTWKAIPSTDATPVTSATGAGVWQFNVAAYTTIRARCSAFTSGPIVVTINVSTAPARSGGGGGGGGSGIVSGQAAGVIPLGTSATVIGSQSHMDDGVTLASTISSTEALQIVSDGVHAGLMAVVGNTTAPSIPSNVFGWIGPNSASFTSYIFQVPSTTPTNGQTLIAGTCSAGVCPITYGAGGSGSKYINIPLGVTQGAGGCALAGSFPLAAAPTCVVLAGSTTVPQRGLPEFTAAGAIGTGTSVTYETVLPSNYTANGNVTLHGSFYCSTSATTGTVTWFGYWADVTPPGVNQPTFSASVSSGAVTVSGSAHNTATFSIAFTSVTASPGDNWFTNIDLDADATPCTPIMSSLYLSY